MKHALKMIPCGPGGSARNVPVMVDPRGQGAHARS